MRRLLAVLTAVTLLAACNGTSPVPVGRPDCDAVLSSALDAWESAGFSGTITISTGGEVDCTGGYGKADREKGTPNTPETVFDIGSITKAVTATAVFSLVDKGKVALDAAVSRYLPELTGPVAAATIRQLLLHTSGLNGSHGADYEPLDLAAAISAIDTLELAFPSGAGYLYSNSGYTLLAAVVERHTGYRDLVTSRILRLPDGRVAGGYWSGEPAAPGPRAVGYLENGETGETGDFAGPFWGMEGNGGLAMTTRDLAAWTHALFAGEIVSAVSTEAIATPGAEIDDGRAETPGWVSYDESVHGVPFLATAGGGGTGHNAVVVWVPEQRRTIAIASNGPEMSAEDLLAAIGPALLSGDPVPRPAKSGGRADTTAIVGRYELDTGGSFDVTAAENRPVIAASGADAVSALFGREARAREYEERVEAMLAGETQVGREERAALDGLLGPVIRVTLAGTVVRDGDTRVYVTIEAGGTSTLAWYALNEAGGVEAAEVPTEPPSLRLVPAGEVFRPDDPTGTGPDVTVEFAGSGLTIAGPSGTTTASRAG